ncbi:hypothetical protein M419DRAFT_133095 [Trichoderma reesei RUT C-30]|jgi:hypothetical protein|uniref:Uncharacterized protein n=1 Tax=Hypocrea jecorina (strain ATCC 56765 / BCRC 32924 / NRRL 11460 / Rut C-30) TaxID=1344414 RepID=A0A024S034_HYPJR|nr:hypothetical protein M419DRAFT_133095 [Trichoderma reesei RUT C-30]
MKCFESKICLGLYENEDKSCLAVKVERSLQERGTARVRSRHARSFWRIESKRRNRVVRESRATMATEGAIVEKARDWIKAEAGKQAGR